MENIQRAVDGNRSLAGVYVCRKRKRDIIEGYDRAIGLQGEDGAMDLYGKDGTRSEIR